MNLDHITLKNTDKYFIYVLNSHSVNEFINYPKPYFTLPNNENIKNEAFKSGDIIIMILQDKTCYKFIGFVQISSDAIINKKIKIFKDVNLNYSYVTLNFRLLCNDEVKLTTVLKELKMPENDFKTSINFAKKFVKKHVIMSVIPFVNGKMIIKHLIQLNEIDSSSESIEEVKKPVKKTIKKKQNSPASVQKGKKTNKKKQNDQSSNSGETNSDETNSDADETSSEVEPGMVPIMLVPCSEFNIIDSKNKIQYFIDHYKSCNKCSYTNNNSVELGSVIDKGNFEFHDIVEETNGYFNPALECYLLAQNYEPLDHNDQLPFIRILYINNDHEIYNGCVLISWLIE